MGRVICPTEQPRLRVRMSEMKRTRIDLVNEELCGAKLISGEMVTYEPGGYVPLHAHPDCEHVFIIVAGEGLFHLEGKDYLVKPETVIFVGPGERHALRNTSGQSFTFIEFFTPATFDTVFFTDEVVRGGEPIPLHELKAMEWEPEIGS